MPTTPFIDQQLVHDVLYASSDRVAIRTSALAAAKIEGSHVADTIASLVSNGLRTGTVVLDIGCGRGTTTLRMAEKIPNAHLFALDRSPALLTTARERFVAAGHSVWLLRADFHDLPLREASINATVAAFCLYHSAYPERVVAEIARCLTLGGRAILVTKSADSYHELDHLLADTGADAGGTRQPSLYTTFHSDNLEQVTATALRVNRIIHEQHTFRFANLNHLAAYLATSPKYHLPSKLVENPRQLAEYLRQRIGEQTITTTSRISYAVAERL